MGRQCITHHACDCNMEQLESLRTELTLSQGRELVLRQTMTAVLRWDFATDGRKFDGNHKEVLRHVLRDIERALTQTPEPPLSRALEEIRDSLEHIKEGVALGMPSNPALQLIQLAGIDESASKALSSLASLLGGGKKS